MGALLVVAFFVLQFHVSELLLAITYRPDSGNVTWRNTLLSWPLLSAYAAAVLEYSGTRREISMFVRGAGLAMMVFGEAVRKTAIITAGRSFSHQIVETQRAQHRLVVSGPFSRHRHPAYVGYCLFVIGSMIFLGNWLCVLIFGCILYRFFDQRIAFEEATLVRLFPDDAEAQESYKSYAKRVTAFPFRSYVHRIENESHSIK